jgi:folate-binding protein YgfZ
MSGPGRPANVSGAPGDDPAGPGTTDLVAAAYAAFWDTAAAVPIPRDVVRVSGPDAEAYLQGQCSQDVSALVAGGSAESLLLSPQGKVEVYLRMTRLGDQEFLIDTDGGFGPAAVARLERFRLRMKVDLEPLNWACLAVRGPDAAPAVTGAPEVVLSVAWAGLEGVDLLGPPPAEGTGGWVAEWVVAAPPEAWEAVRIEAGVPVNGRELVEGTIAAEVGLVERTVSFTKGCFTGQELVARLDARGSKVARRLRGLVIETGPGGGPFPPDAAPLLVGSAVRTHDGEHEVGRLSSAAWSPGHGAPVALATLHRRIEVPEAVVVLWDAGNGEHRLLAQARVLPLTPADR